MVKITHRSEQLPPEETEFRSLREEYLKYDYLVGKLYDVYLPAVTYIQNDCTEPFLWSKDNKPSLKSILQVADELTLFSNRILKGGNEQLRRSVEEFTDNVKHTVILAKTLQKTYKEHFSHSDSPEQTQVDLRGLPQRNPLVESFAEFVQKDRRAIKQELISPLKEQKDSLESQLQDEGWGIAQQTRKLFGLPSVSSEWKEASCRSPVAHSPFLIFHPDTIRDYAEDKNLDHREDLGRNDILIAYPGVFNKLARDRKVNGALLRNPICLHFRETAAKIIDKGFFANDLAASPMIQFYPKTVDHMVTNKYYEPVQSFFSTGAWGTYDQAKMDLSSNPAFKHFPDLALKLAYNARAQMNPLGASAVTNNLLDIKEFSQFHDEIKEVGKNLRRDIKRIAETPRYGDERHRMSTSLPYWDKCG